MRTATVRELRNSYTTLLGWIGAGEEIVITRRGKAIARLIPEQGDAVRRVDWAESPAVSRDRTKSRVLTKAETTELLREASGKW